MTNHTPRRSPWPLALVTLALVGNAGAALAAPDTSTTQPTETRRYTYEEYRAPSRNNAFGYIMIGGNQAFILRPVAGFDTVQRFMDIRDRIMGVVQPGDSNTAVKIVPEDVTVQMQGYTPVLMLKGVPLVTVTDADADMARTDPWLLAHQWAGDLRRSITKYKVGETLPPDFITMKFLPGGSPVVVSTPGQRTQPAAVPGIPPGSTPTPDRTINALGQVGNVSFDVKKGVVTLNGSVESNFERAMAELRVRRIPGVTKVINNIEVRMPNVQAAPVPPAEVPDTELGRHVNQELLTIIRLNSPVPLPNGP